MPDDDLFHICLALLDSYFRYQYIICDFQPYTIFQQNQKLDGNGLNVN